MNKGSFTTLRAIYACGYVGLVVAVARASTQLASDWFAEAVLQGAVFVAISTGVLWACSETLIRYIPRRGLLSTALAVAFAAVLVPDTYSIGAAYGGLSQAKFDTWHLLSLFAIVHQVQAVLLVVIFAGVFAVVFAFIRFVTNKRVARMQ